jgi:hypothetical protein
MQRVLETRRAVDGHGHQAGRRRVVALNGDDSRDGQASEESREPDGGHDTWRTEDGKPRIIAKAMVP